MIGRTLATTVLLLATAVPFVPVASAWVCVPAQDADAPVVTAGSTTYYLRTYGTSAYRITELWHETNGERGLQTTAGMSCGGRADRMVSSACTGLCPLPF